MRLAIGADRDDFEAILHFKSKLCYTKVKRFLRQDSLITICTHPPTICLDLHPTVDIWLGFKNPYISSGSGCNNAGCNPLLEWQDGSSFTYQPSYMRGVTARYRTDCIKMEGLLLVVSHLSVNRLGRTCGKKGFEVRR